MEHTWWDNCFDGIMLVGHWVANNLSNIQQCSTHNVSEFKVELLLPLQLLLRKSFSDYIVKTLGMAYWELGKTLNFANEKEKRLKKEQEELEKWKQEGVEGVVLKRTEDPLLFSWQ